MRCTFLLFLIIATNLSGQDTVYARKVISYLTSETCFGRGYVKGGLQKAEKFLVNEMKEKGLKPFFGGNYTQVFYHSVNIFPKKCEVSINGKVLEPGLDYILDPDCAGGKIKGSLTQKDSLNFTGIEQGKKIEVLLKKKLTYSVGAMPKDFYRIELDKARIKEIPKNIEINITSKFVKQFKSRNIAAFIPGKKKSDSIIVFSAHYDHLGGMGSKTFFPGANDNASGVSMVLNFMNYYVNNPPDYTTLFIFFAGEEAGLLGSKYFVESKALDLKKIKFLINLDLLGTGDDGIMVVNGAIHEKQFEALNKLNTEGNFVKQVKKRGKAANSDHYWFTEAGVPCFFIYTMGGISAYHDVLDRAQTLPLTDYVDVFKLLIEFVKGI